MMLMRAHYVPRPAGHVEERRGAGVTFTTSVIPAIILCLLQAVTIVSSRCDFATTQTLKARRKP